MESNIIENNELKAFEKFVKWIGENIDPSVDPTEDLFSYTKCGGNFRSFTAKYNESKPEKNTCEEFISKRTEYDEFTSDEEEHVGNTLKDSEIGAYCGYANKLKRIEYDDDSSIEVGGYNEYPQDFIPIFEDETFYCPLINKVRDFKKSIDKWIGKRINPRRILENQDFINYCGGVPHFNKNWTSFDFNWIRAIDLLQVIITFRVHNCGGKTKYDFRIAPEDTEGIEPIDILRKRNKNLKMTEDELLDIADDAKDILEIIRAIRYDMYEEPLDGVRNYEEFDRAIDITFDYRTFFNTINRGPLDNQDEIEINKSWHYFDCYMKILMECPPKIVANFITFEVIREGIDIDIPSDLIDMYFGSINLAIGFTKYFNSYEDYKRLELNKYCSKCFKMEIPTDNNEHLPYIITNVDKLDEIVNTYFTYEKVSEEYANLEISPDDYVQNIINLRILGSPSSLRRCCQMCVSCTELSYSGILKFYQKHYEKPMIFYFVYWLVECDKFSLPYCQKHMENYTQIKDFLNNQLLNMNYIDEIADPDDYLITNCISQIVMLKIAFKAYMVWLNDNKEIGKIEEEILKRFNLTHSKAFFIVFGLLLKDYYEGVESVIDYLPILNSFEFAEAFECGPESPMTLKNKCVIRWKEKKLLHIKNVVIRFVSRLGRSRN